MQQKTASEIWQGRDDMPDEGGLGQRLHQAITQQTLEAAEVVLLGFQCDAGVLRNHGRIGAAAAPVAFRRQLVNLPVHDDAPIPFDAGDVICQGDALEAAQALYANIAADYLRQGKKVLGLGGGHEIAYASFSGLRDAVSAQTRIGIVNFDAHLDLRYGKRASSGTPFYQIHEDCLAAGRSFHYLCLGVSHYANTAALFERAKNWGVHMIADDACHYARLAELKQQLDAFLATVDAVYLTIDLDCLPAAVMPAVSAPAAFGIDLAVVEALAEHLAKSGQLRLVDFAELNPLYDIDNRGARTAARLVAKVLEAWR